MLQMKNFFFNNVAIKLLMRLEIIEEDVVANQRIDDEAT